MNRGVVSVFVACIIVAMFFLPSMAKKSTKEMDRGEQVFKQHCANCHAGGGNTVKPSRPIAGSKELASILIFKNYLSAPPGHMPYYQSIVHNQTTLNALYMYCKSLEKPTKQAYAGGH